jgi:hypothetical protein
LFSHIRTHSNGRKPLTIVQGKQKEAYMVDLVLAVEEKHNIECPTLMLWVVVNVSQACGTYEYILWVVVLTFSQVFGLSLPRGRSVAIFVSSEDVQGSSLALWGMIFQI